MSSYLLFPEDLLEVLEHDSLHGVYYHPQCREGLPYQLLTLVPRVPQVWTLTQFYSVDFPQSRISEKECDVNKRTIKVCVSCFLTASWDHHA